MEYGSDTSEVTTSWCFTNMFIIIINIIIIGHFCSVSLILTKIPVSSCPDIFGLWTFKTAYPVELLKPTN